MLRSPRTPSGAELDSEDAPSMPGLADVLEPAFDPDFASESSDSDAVTSLRRIDALALSGPRSVRHEPSAARVSDPISLRARVPLQDFAFADTVSTRELDDSEPPPASGGVYVGGPTGSTRCVTPLAFPLAPKAPEVDWAAYARTLPGRARFAIRFAAAEMRELWDGTAEIVLDGGYGPPPSSRFAFFVRRTVALWSCFQWSRADLTRAAMIGGAVFLLAATIGTAAIDSPAAGVGSQVRAPRTLDQHTGIKIVVHAKR